MKTTSCVLDWRGGTRDWSRNHHTLTEHNTIPVRGVNGEAREFNGVDAYIDCGNDASLNITTDAITIEAWVKMQTITITQYFVAKNSAYRFRYDHINNYLVWIIYTSDGTQVVHKTGHGIGDLAWHQIVVTYDKDGGINNIKIHIDGTLFLQGTGTGTINTNINNLMIGVNTALNDYLNGTIDEVRIYNRALTPLEIWNNYQVMKPYIPLSEIPVAIV